MYESWKTTSSPAKFTRDTECYATEIEQSALGAMTKPIDQVGAFITAVVLFVNVIPRL